MYSSVASRLVPDARAEDQARIVDVAAFLAGERRGLAEGPGVGETDVRGEFAGDLVTQPQTGIDLGQTRADPPGGLALAIEVHLDLGLQNQPVGNEQVV